MFDCKFNVYNEIGEECQNECIMCRLLSIVVSSDSSSFPARWLCPQQPCVSCNFHDWAGLCCAVVSLGRINWINPAFHNEKGLWPVGFVSLRIATTPTGGTRSVPHRCEVLEHPRTGGPLFRRAPMLHITVTWSCQYNTRSFCYQHGCHHPAHGCRAHLASQLLASAAACEAMSYPVWTICAPFAGVMWHRRVHIGQHAYCRVTVEGGQPVKGATPTMAWSALYGASQRARVVAVCGARLFGLSDKRVLQLLTALPNAHRCERFCNWPAGDRPPPPPLVRPTVQRRHHGLSHGQPHSRNQRQMRFGTACPRVTCLGPSMWINWPRLS